MGGKEITVWRRWVSVHVGNAVHMVQDHRGVVNRITSQESINCFKYHFIVGFLGVGFRVEYANKYVM